MVNYQREVEGLANAINKVSNYVPRRRARKLHIGLFGYSRGFRGVVFPGQSHSSQRFIPWVYRPRCWGGSLPLMS